MAKTWQQVYSTMEQETERIWVDEPLEITKLRMGITEFDAGSFGQIFAVILNLNGETRSFAVRGCFHLIKDVEDPEITLEALVSRTKQFLPNNAGTMHYLGLKKLKSFSEDILEVLDQLQSKDDFKKLIGALYTYANRIMFWVHEITPHGLGLFYPKWNKKALNNLKKTMESDSE